VKKASNKVFLPILPNNTYVTNSSFHFPVFEHQDPYNGN